jgi:hypothetical protein
MAIWLVFLIAPLETIPTECFVGGALGAAPTNPPLELDLPPSRNVEGGVLVAPERAAEMAWRMRCYQLWPRVAQMALDIQAEAHAVEIAEQQRVTQSIATMRLERPEPAGWPGWLVAIVAGGAGAAVGLSAGLILGIELPGGG